MLAGIPGVVAGSIATVIERLEFGFIDDNILITFSATATLLLLQTP
jgi:hypothetical protein